MAHSSAPARRFRRASIEGKEPLMNTNGHESREEGEERRKQCVDTLQWASVKEG